MVKILIIDDSSFQQKILTSILKEAGYDVVIAENGKEGLECAEKEKPDVMITDLLMPEFDGYFLLENMKAKNLQIPVIISTSDVQDYTRQRCARLGAAGFLNKPVKKETLLPAIKKVLAGERL
jgi:two-component system, chemotaxis family, chemotaxis protein CheY